MGEGKERRLEREIRSGGGHGREIIREGREKRIEREIRSGRE